MYSVCGILTSISYRRAI